MTAAARLQPRQARLAVVGIGILAVTAAGFVRAPLLPDMGRALALSDTALGAIVSCFAFGRILADIPAGRLTDRVPSGLMMATGAALVGAGSVVSGLAPGPAAAFAGAFVLGIGSAWTNTTGLATFAAAPRHRRGVSMSGFAASLMVGQAFGPTLGGAVASVYDWRAGFLSGAFVAVAVALVFLVFFRHSPPRHPATAAQDPLGDAGEPRRLVLASLYLLPAAQFAIGASLLQTLIPIVGDGELDLTPGVIGLAIGGGGLARLVGVLVSGKISDTHSRRWALIPGLAIQLVGLIVFALNGSLVGWMITILLTSLGSSAVNVGATVLADLSEGSKLGRRLGLFRVTGDVALLIAPLVAGALYDSAGRAVAMVPLIVFVAVILGFSMRVVPETFQRGPSRPT